MKGNSKRNWMIISVALAGLVLGQSAQAIVIDESGAGSTFDFGGLTWTTDFSGSTPNTGEIEYADNLVDRTDVAIRGSNNGSGILSNTGISTTATVDGSIDFSWLYSTFDSNSFWDSFFWINSGSGSTTVKLTTDGVTGQGGAESMLVAAGDAFGFSMESLDNVAGIGQVMIADFVYSDLGGNPVGVPTPSFLAIFGTGLMAFGLVSVRRRQS